MRKTKNDEHCNKRLEEAHKVHSWWGHRGRTKGRGRGITLTLSTLTTSAGNVISGVVTTRRYMRSTNMPARMACATDLNLGLSSPLRRVHAICLVNVDASQSRTSCGTASGCTSDSSSSSSAASRLRATRKSQTQRHRGLSRLPGSVSNRAPVTFSPQLRFIGSVGPNTIENTEFACSDWRQSNQHSWIKPEDAALCNTTVHRPPHVHHR